MRSPSDYPVKHIIAHIHRFYKQKNRPGATNTEAARNYTGRTDITHPEQVKLYHSPGKNTSYRAFLCLKGGYYDKNKI